VAEAPIDPETGQPIPYELTTAGSGNVVGPDLSIDPMTGKPRPKEEEPGTREKDESRAAAMASTAGGNSLRTLAAEHRKLAALAERDAAVKDDGTPLGASEAVGARKQADGYRELAAEKDELAAHYEEWAAILHDEPVSEAYQVAHLEIVFTPEGLVGAEGLLSDSLLRAQEEQEELEAFDDP